jgi:hypothetical protein
MELAARVLFGGRVSECEGGPPFRVASSALARARPRPGDITRVKREKGEKACRLPHLSSRQILFFRESFELEFASSANHRRKIARESSTGAQEFTSAQWPANQVQRGPVENHLGEGGGGFADEMVLSLRRRLTGHSGTLAFGPARAGASAAGGAITGGGQRVRRTWIPTTPLVTARSSFRPNHLKDIKSLSFQDISDRFQFAQVYPCGVFRPVDLADAHPSVACRTNALTRYPDIVPAPDLAKSRDTVAG